MTFTVILLIILQYPDLEQLSHSLLYTNAGFVHVGCYAVPMRSRYLRLLEGSKDLTDDPTRRVSPIQKCGKAAIDGEFGVFGVSLGFCISGSNDITHYQRLPADSCSNGEGGYSRSAFLMDVYKLPETEQLVQDPIAATTDDPTSSLHLLANIQSVGCYVLNRHDTSLIPIEGLTTNLTDNPLRRTNPILRCRKAASELGYGVFGVSLGYCILGSSDVLDFQQEPAHGCDNGTGGYVHDVMLMNVYVFSEEHNYDPPDPTHDVRVRGVSADKPTEPVSQLAEGGLHSGAISPLSFGLTTVVPLTALLLQTMPL